MNDAKKYLSIIILLYTQRKCRRYTPHQDLHLVISGIDGDESGTISITEFLASALNRKEVLTDHTLWKAFSEFDLDGDGRITKDELM